MKVFVTVGTHNQGFEYLLNKVALHTSEFDFCVQAGHSKTKVLNVQHQQEWFTPEEMTEKIKTSDVLHSYLYKVTSFNIHAHTQLRC